MLTMGENFNKMDYKILEQLIGNECYSLVRAFSIKKISKETGFSEVKIRQTIKMFLMCGVVKEGAKDGNKKTYYTTNEGYELYKRAMDYDDNDIEKLKDIYISKEEEITKC